MNQLSWLIYLADVADGLAGVLHVIIILCCICLVILLGVTFCAVEDFDDDDWKIWKTIVLKTLVPIFFFCSLLLAVLPSSQTVYAIAASEMGEEILDSETGNKVVKALNGWLDNQISGEEQTENVE